MKKSKEPKPKMLTDSLVIDILVWLILAAVRGGPKVKHVAYKGLYGLGWIGEKEVKLGGWVFKWIVFFWSVVLFGIRWLVLVFVILVEIVLRAIFIWIGQKAILGSLKAILKFCWRKLIPFELQRPLMEGYLRLLDNGNPQPGLGMILIGFITVTSIMFGLIQKLTVSGGDFWIYSPLVCLLVFVFFPWLISLIDNKIIWPLQNKEWQWWKETA